VIDADAWLAVWEAGDDRVRELSTDDVEVVAVTVSIEPRHYHGPDGVKQWLDDLRADFGASWTAEKLTRIDPSAVVVEGTLRFERPSPTGTTEQTFAALMRLRDEKVAWIGTFVTLEAAKDAWERGIAGRA
jgi:hypothetical protein